jgi:hypothetical protein
MDLPTAGKYLVINDNPFPFVVAQTLTATAPTTPRAAPPSSATVNALTKRRFGGSKVLPAKGTITFNNKSTESPHFLVLSQVKKGTTRKQVFKQVKRGFKGPNHFVKGGDQAGSDVLGEGKSQTLNYHVHKGTYAELCFFNDPKTGMLHALMGMIRIVHVK